MLLGFPFFRACFTFLGRGGGLQKPSFFLRPYQGLQKAHGVWFQIAKLDGPLQVLAHRAPDCEVSEAWQGGGRVWASCGDFFFCGRGRAQKGGPKGNQQFLGGPSVSLTPIFGRSTGFWFDSLLLNCLNRAFGDHGLISHELIVRFPPRGPQVVRRKWRLSLSSMG